MQEINKIEKDSRIAIYGAGEVGILIKNYIENNRPDLKIIRFFDKFEKPEIDGVIVNSIKNVQELKDVFDLVIVASCTNIGIMETILRNYGINNYVHLNNFFINEIESQEICTKKEEAEKITEVQNILYSEKSKKAFELMVSARNCKHCLKELSSYIKEQNKKIHPGIREQYMDFINKEEIKTVISGGAYDAGTTLLFLDQLKNIEKIYAFEPMYDDFKCEINHGIISKTGKVKIIKKGLFDKTGESSFLQNDYASTICNAVNLGSKNIIKTVSIDDFVKENNINKIDFIKMDIEGVELSALKGAESTILNHRPQLAICIYHSYNELFDIPLYLNNLLNGYRFEVYHYSLNTVLESVLYAIPEELCK